MTRANFLKTLTGLLASPFIPASAVAATGDYRNIGLPSYWKLCESIHAFVEVKPKVTFGGQDSWFFFRRKIVEEDGMTTGYVDVCSTKGDKASFFDVFNKPEFDGFILPSSESLAARAGSPKEIEMCITPQIPYLKSIEEALKTYCDTWVEYASDHEVSEAEAQEFASFANFIRFNGNRVDFAKMVKEWEERTGLTATFSHVLLNLRLMKVANYEVSCIKV